MLDGYVSAESARQSYGVVVDATGEVDAAATEARRAEIRAARQDRPLQAINYGPVREAYEVRWPSELHDAISAELADLPRVQRQTGHQALYAEIGRKIDAGEAVSPAQVPAIYKDLRAGKLSSRRLAKPL